MRSRQKHKARPPAAAARRAAQIVTNMDAWHGPSGYDVRHRAVVSYVYQLPFGQGRRWMGDAGGLLDGTVGGWQLSGITTMTTGRAFTVFLQTGVNNGASSWPNRIGSGKLDNPSVDMWFNPADCPARRRARRPTFASRQAPG